MKFKFSALVLAIIFPISLMAMNNSRYGDVKLSFLSPNESSFGWERSKNFSPKYPVELARDGMAGCGIFKISINDQGKARVDEVVSYLPKKAVRKESIKLIKSWKWKQIDGASGNKATIRLDYCLGGNSLEEAQALCLAQSELPCTE